jgi:hypothetical protein
MRSLGGGWGLVRYKEMMGKRDEGWVELRPPAWPGHRLIGISFRTQAQGDCLK